MSVFLIKSKQMDQLKLTSVHSALYACKHLQNLKSLENVNLCFNVIMKNIDENSGDVNDTIFFNNMFL